MSNQYPVLIPELQVSFSNRLKTIRELYLSHSLINTIKELNIKDLDNELAQFVSEVSLKKVALFSLRGENIFPVPSLLKRNPFLVGYYRLLLGFSQKEFYTKGPFGIFKTMEEKGICSIRNESELPEFCRSLISSLEYLVNELNDLTPKLITELQLLTIGPQLRGGMNNVYGQMATEKTFVLIKEIVKAYVVSSTPTSIEIVNDTGRKVNISFSSDPDIEISEVLASHQRGLVSIEIKGGKDFSNVHNRIGEAEKSHQKAKQRGYFEFITILNVDVDYTFLKQESPTTSHFFNLGRLLNPGSTEYIEFYNILLSILSIHGD